MTITTAMIVCSLIATVLVIVGAGLFLHVRSNAGLNKEREELAKAHKIVMEMARVYRMPHTLRKAERLDEMRGQILNYFDEAIEPEQEMDLASEGMTVLSFNRAKYKS